MVKLKAVYESLNEKRMESGIKAKRDFWGWLKDMFEAPGLKARSSVPTSVSPIPYCETNMANAEPLSDARKQHLRF